MRHIHLFEFTDMPWYPDIFRRIQTDYLQFVASLGTADRFLFPLIQKALQGTETTEIVDLCSGGAGPWVHLEQRFSRAGMPIYITLTDKFPNPDAIRHWNNGNTAGITYLAESVDAVCVPTGLKGMRTLFEGLHHFKPDQASKILADAYTNRAPIGIFEISLKPYFGWVLLLLSPLMTLVSYFLLTPFITPQSFLRYLWTYLLPLVPLATCWDGVVSLLRVYSVDELRELTRPLQGDGYAWEAGLASTGTPIFEYIYLIGYPT
jgi:hypothetical protein